MSIVEFPNLRDVASDACLLSVVLTQISGHGGPETAASLCPICQTIWRIREACAILNIEVEASSSFDHPA